MKHRCWWLTAIPFLLIVAFAVVVRDTAQADDAIASTAPAGFAAENARAMDRMMAAMAVAPSGDTDRDFVATMVPHHRGAIDMALAELRYGHDETLRRMAQEIIVEQKQEIDAMKLAAERLPETRASSLATGEICQAAAPSSHAHIAPVTRGH